MFRDVVRAFGGEGALSERQGAILVALAGVSFSITAISYRAVESATEWQFLAYRGGSTAVIGVDCSTPTSSLRACPHATCSAQLRRPVASSASQVE